MAQSKPLPARPSLEHLKKQAKLRLVQLRRAQPGAKLAHAQLEVAREYGFASWRALQASLRVRGDDVLAELSKIFRTFAQVECVGRSNLYEQLSLAIANDADLLRLASKGRVPFPNLFLAGVHALLLRDPSAPLARFYPSIERTPQPAQDASPEFRRFCLEHRDDIVSLMRARRVQTNEVARSGYLLPAFALAAQLVREQPLALIEIGASAGLNLCFDHYAFDYGPRLGVRGEKQSALKLPVELRGEFLPPLSGAAPQVAQRIGIDLQPISADDCDGVAWLEALVWPEHHERRAQLRTALSIARNVFVRMIAGDASKILATVLKEIPADQVPCVFQTHALNQFTPDSRAQLFKTLDDVGSKRELLFISRENRLTLDHYHHGEKEVMLLADCDAHGKWIEWKLQPRPQPDLRKYAQRAVREMERGWAESAAIVERRFYTPGEEPYWEEAGISSPRLREREADQRILERKQPGQYRMISIWHHAKIAPGRREFGVRPTRALEYFRGGDATMPPRGGTWRRIPLPLPTWPALGKAGRWEDISAALKYLQEDAPPGMYRVITVRRMLRAGWKDNRMRIVKKHAGADCSGCLGVVER